MQSSNMKKKQGKSGFWMEAESNKYGRHFDWLLLAFISFVIILLVFVISF